MVSGVDAEEEVHRSLVVAASEIHCIVVDAAVAVDAGDEVHGTDVLDEMVADVECWLVVAVVVAVYIHV